VKRGSLPSAERVASRRRGFHSRGAGDHPGGMARRRRFRQALRMSVLFGLLLCALLQHHAHDAPLVVTGRGDPIRGARTVAPRGAPCGAYPSQGPRQVARHGPSGHLARLDERLEATARADVGGALGPAVRRADPPRVAVLVAAGRGEARLHVLDGRTLEETSPPLLLGAVARPSGPLATRG